MSACGRIQVNDIELISRLVWLHKTNKRLRAALEAVERDADGYCLWCDTYMKNGHDPDCQRQAALKESDDD
jgi:hypothetical protein